MDTDEIVINKIHELKAIGEITDMHGDGQATCRGCGTRSWCCFLYEYKDKIYCYQCLQEVIKNEYNL